MKKRVHSFATILLLFVLTNAALAGQMDTTVPTPPPPTANGQMDTTAPASGQPDILSAAATDETITSDAIKEFALDILMSLQLLF